MRLGSLRCMSLGQTIGRSFCIAGQLERARSTTIVSRPIAESIDNLMTSL